VAKKKPIGCIVCIVNTNHTIALRRPLLGRHDDDDDRRRRGRSSLDMYTNAARTSSIQHIVLMKPTVTVARGTPRSPEKEVLGGAGWGTYAAASAIAPPPRPTRSPRAPAEIYRHTPPGLSGEAVGQVPDGSHPRGLVDRRRPPPPRRPHVRRRTPASFQPGRLARPPFFKTRPPDFQPGRLARPFFKTFLFF
jgi:hypothetical protein